MIFTRNTNGSYTIDLSPSIKNVYNSTTDVYVNGVNVANNLPAIAIGIAGVVKIRVYLTGPSGTYNEEKCALIDSEIECNILSKVAKMSDKEKANSNLPYLWFLVKEGSDDQACACVCDSIKKIYEDLKSEVEENCCC